MGRENTIRTGISIPNRMLDMASSMNNTRSTFTPRFEYGLVRVINPDTKGIIYSPIVSNVPATKTGTAIPISTNFLKLPEPGSVVKIFPGPSTDASTANAVGTNTMYYDPVPVTVWKVPNDNKLDQTPTPKPKEVKPTNKDIKTASLGIPHNSGGKNTGNGPKPTHNYIISKPLASDNTFAIIIGGYPSSANGAAQIKKLAESAGITGNKNIIFSDYENSTESLMNIVKKDYPNATFSSFSGWSRGGLNAWEEVGNFPFVGLMDPSMPKNNIPNTTDPGAFMMYNPNNWHTSYPLIESNQRLYGPKMGNRATEVKEGHSAIPVTFLKTYKNRL